VTAHVELSIDESNVAREGMAVELGERLSARHLEIHTKRPELLFLGQTRRARKERNSVAGTLEPAEQGPLAIFELSARSSYSARSRPTRGGTNALAAADQPNIAVCGERTSVVRGLSAASELPALHERSADVLISAAKIWAAAVVTRLTRKGPGRFLVEESANSVATIEPWLAVGDAAATLAEVPRTDGD
jgi:hypothetical protein